MFQPESRSTGLRSRRWSGLFELLRSEDAPDSFGDSGLIRFRLIGREKSGSADDCDVQTIIGEK